MDKCEHIWVKVGFPLDGNWYIQCEKCRVSKSNKPKKDRMKDETTAMLDTGQVGETN